MHTLPATRITPMNESEDKTMDSVYDDYYKQALNLQYHFHDSVNDHAHPQIQSLEREVHSLVDDFKEHKAPRDAEHRIEIIQHQLLQLRSQGHELMPFTAADGMHHSYQQ